MDARPALLFVFVLGAPTGAHADTVQFATGEFLESEWMTVLFPGLAGSATATTVPTGGNPGAYRQVNLTVAPNQSVLAAQFYSAARFSPSRQGAVTSAALSYDATRISSSSPAAVQVVEGLAVLQDGQMFIALAGVTTNTPPAWDDVDIANLLPLFPGVNWVDGSDITFGFYDSVSATQTGFSISGGYDNFAVTVNFTPAPVPLPAAAWLLAAGAGGLGAWRLPRRAWTAGRSERT